MEYLEQVFAVNKATTLNKKQTNEILTILIKELEMLWVMSSWSV